LRRCELETLARSACYTFVAVVLAFTDGGSNFTRRVARHLVGERIGISHKGTQLRTRLPSKKPLSRFNAEKRCIPHSKYGLCAKLSLPLLRRPPRTVPHETWPSGGPLRTPCRPHNRYPVCGPYRNFCCSLPGANPKIRGDPSLECRLTRRLCPKDRLGRTVEFPRQ
jgi:hypothetical protein